jgi:hypothetical protein
MVEIRTDDLWLSALALARGGRLVELQLEGANGRRTAVFRIAGVGLAGLEEAYARGTAEANVLELKGQMSHLKDVLFARMRREERSGCTSPKRRSNG